MNLTLIQKFRVISVIAGALISIVSIIGYYMSDKGLSETLEREISAIIDARGNELDGWLGRKAASAEYAANMFTALNGDMARMKTRENIALDISVRICYFKSSYVA